MTKSVIEIALVSYPGVLQSAVHGLDEMFTLANDIAARQGETSRFSVEHMDLDAIREALGGAGQTFRIVLFPPSLKADYYLDPDDELKSWIRDHHGRGAILCSACAGAFILASAGLLERRTATTHWGLAGRFAEQFPDVELDIQKILINGGDVITSAGVMSWVDLGLELVAQFMSPGVMRQLGKSLIVDTGPREQRYYESFQPRLDHGDAAILATQHYLLAHFSEPVAIADLPALCHLAPRTFLRRFVKATGMKPAHYIQRLRIQRACDLLESSAATVDVVSLKAGYADVSAFRKIFARIVGLTPREFRARFAGRGGAA